jgi:hypothetical protein
MKQKRRRERERERVREKKMILFLKEGVTITYTLCYAADTHIKYRRLKMHNPFLCYRIRR